MATHAGAQESSGNGHDTFDEGSGSDPYDESQFDEKVAEWGLEPTKAYVRVARGKKQVSQATTDKREYRAQRKALGFGQYVVEVPVDEAAKRIVYAVAQAIVDDEKNTKKSARSFCRLFRVRLCLSCASVFLRRASMPRLSPS